MLDWFSRARVSAVLTAHPTEVQRQSILDCEREIAASSRCRRRAARRGAARRGAAPVAHGDAAAPGLAVADEIANALAYFRLTFLPELPRLYAELEEALRSGFALRARALAAALPHRGHLGRRRPRRQPERRRADARARGVAAGAARARPLPGGGEPARASWALRAADEDAGRGPRARRALRRRLALPARRAVPARGVGHLQPPRRDAPGAGRRGGGAGAARRACRRTPRPPSSPPTWT